MFNAPIFFQRTLKKNDSPYGSKTKFPYGVTMATQRSDIWSLNLNLSLILFKTSFYTGDFRRTIQCNFCRTEVATSVKLRV